MEKNPSDRNVVVGVLAVTALLVFVGVVGTNAAWDLAGREGSPSVSDRFGFLVLWGLVGLASRIFERSKSPEDRKK